VTKRIINIYAQRHGQKKGDALTEDGITQIVFSRQSGILANVDFKAFYASPANRTQQTAKLVAQDESLVQTNYGLYAPLTDKQIDHIWGVQFEGLDHPPTVADWYRALPNNWGVRMHDLLHATFAEMALEAVRDYPEENEINVYEAGHGLVLELALPEEQQTMLPMGLADVIVFKIEVDEDKGCRMASAKHHPYA